MREVVLVGCGESVVDVISLPGPTQAETTSKPVRNGPARRTKGLITILYSFLAPAPTLDSVARYFEMSIFHWPSSLIQVTELDSVVPSFSTIS